MNVFVSRPNWLPEKFRPGLNVFLARLSDLSLKPRTIGATDYPTKAPLDEVIKLMNSCRGAVVLGYPQIEIGSGTVKGELLTVPLLLPTEWNHIEAGLAYARGLPLLVIHHVGISRGIFDRGAMNSFIFCKNLEEPTWSVSEDLGGAMRSWRDEVLGFSPTPTRERESMYQAITKEKDSVWTVEAIGRKIRDPRPVGNNYRESAECRIVELADYYVRISVLASGEYITIPFRDVVISYDDKRHRPKLQIRA